MPEPGVVGVVGFGFVPGWPLMPEPLVPEPLLPAPEVWASTKGAVTTSTARAVTTILLNLLNISKSPTACMAVLSGFLLELVPCAPLSVGTVLTRQRSNSYAMDTRRPAHGLGDGGLHQRIPSGAWLVPPAAPMPACYGISSSLILRVDASDGSYKRMAVQSQPTFSKSR